MIRAIICSLIIFLFPILATCQEYYGQDVLGLAMQDAKMITQELPYNSAIGVLEGTFGDVKPKLEIVLKTGKIKIGRSHLRDATCFRNRNCPPGTPPLTDWKLLTNRAKAHAALYGKYGVRCLLSPWLEYDTQKRAEVEKAVAVLREAAPSCEVVLSPFRGVTIPGTIIERHGNKARAQIVSNDGESIFDSESVSYRSAGSLITFAWLHRYNLRVSGEKTFVPPLKRTAKATKDNVRQAVRLLRPQTSPPSAIPGCQTLRTVKERELGKTNAEDYNNGDRRGDKFLFITKLKKSRMDIVSAEGKRIGCVKHYGPYEGDRGYSRHYLGDCSGQAPAQLMDQARGEWIAVKDGKNCILVNAIRRKGYYR